MTYIQLKKNMNRLQKFIFFAYTFTHVMKEILTISEALVKNT